jgi:zinc transporter ZupT
LFRRWNQKQLHLFVAFGGGTILGAIFLHLLPDSLSMGSPELASSMVLVGFLVILLIERLVLHGRGHDEMVSSHLRHQVVGITALVGLSVHSLAGGFALAVGLISPEVGLIIFIAIIAHKATEAFSLSTIFRLAEFPRKKAAGLLILYSFMTPIGALISLPFLELMERIDLSIPTGLTAGTFLYVATLDLIPEAFHSDGKILPFIWMFAGILIMYLLKIFGV